MSESLFKMRRRNRVFLSLAPATYHSRDCAGETAARTSLQGLSSGSLPAVLTSSFSCHHRGPCGRTAVLIDSMSHTRPTRASSSMQPRLSMVYGVDRIKSAQKTRPPEPFGVQILHHDDPHPSSSRSALPRSHHDPRHRVLLKIVVPACSTVR